MLGDINSWTLLIGLSTLSVSCVSEAHRHYLDAPGALGPYSAAVDIGSTVFLAGKVGKQRDTFESEVNSAIDAVERDLGRLQLDLTDVVSVNVFVTDIDRYQDVNSIYAERFSAPYPARTFVGVAALPGGARIEIQAVAAQQ